MYEPDRRRTCWRRRARSSIFLYVQLPPRPVAFAFGFRSLVTWLWPRLRPVCHNTPLACACCWQCARSRTSPLASSVLRWTLKGVLGGFMGVRGDIFDISTIFGGGAGVMLETTTAQAASAWDTPDFVMRETMRHGTPLETVVESHRERVQEYRSQHRGVRPTAVHTVLDVMTAVVTPGSRVGASHAVASTHIIPSSCRPLTGALRQEHGAAYGYFSSWNDRHAACARRPELVRTVDDRRSLGRWIFLRENNRSKGSEHPARTRRPVSGIRQPDLQRVPKDLGCPDEQPKHGYTLIRRRHSAAARTVSELSFDVRACPILNY
jgi:hypothetical protein